LEALLARAQVLGMPVALLNAQTHAAPFYTRHGFAPYGNEFLEAGIPHVAMRRDLSGAGD
jgi:predicted GNAT family N-acyltransferase